MQLCRFYLPDHGARLGGSISGRIYDLTASGQPTLVTLSALLQASLAAPIPDLLAELDLTNLPSYRFAELDREPDHEILYMLPPVDRQEVWAAGVTYEWSREARVREAHSKDIYVRVYEADRPELFFKSLGEKAVGPNDWIGLRGDSHWNVPEPELTLVLNPELEIVGYTIGNDVSCRDIEGENPLYLPQAKIYRHCCALGPAITLAADVKDPRRLNIRMTITRDGAAIFAGATSTEKISRELPELAAFLGRYNDFPHGALLMTGTGIVPPDDLTLREGDKVHIQVDAIGSLNNVARQMSEVQQTQGT